MKNEHVYAIGCWLEVDHDVISGSNKNTIQNYVGLNLKGASFSTFRDIQNRTFCDGEIGNGSGSINAICSRPEVADYLIPCKGVDTFRC